MRRLFSECLPLLNIPLPVIRWARCCQVAVLALVLNAPLKAEELPSAEMERLGRLSGEVLLHAAVLKRLAGLCPALPTVPDPVPQMEREVAKMPEDFQSAFSMQFSTIVKVGDFIVRDLIKKSGGCTAEEVSKARNQAEAVLELALRNWRAR